MSGRNTKSHPAENKLSKALPKILRPVSFQHILVILTFVLLIGLALFYVFTVNDVVTDTAISSYQETELEVVREAARAIQEYVYEQTEVLGRSDISAIEQEIFIKFVAPIHLLSNGDAWIYAPDHIVFDRSEDFPDEYRGKSMAEIFALQEQSGASHFEEMTSDVSHAREGVGYYIWLPEKGPEIAAWTPVQVGNYTWTIGLSTPLSEILAATGATSQIALSTAVILISIIVGIILLVIWLFSDSRRRKFEIALQESETKFREIYNNTNDAIHIHEIMEGGVPGKFIDVNDVACHMLQYTREEFLNHTPLDFTTDYHNPPLETILNELETKGVAKFETGHVRKDGRIVPVEINSHVIMLQDKKVMIGVVRDITDRKKAEEALIHEKATVESILTSLPGMFYMFYLFDRHGRFVRWNKNLETLTGYSEEEVRDMTPVDFIAEESKSHISAAIKKALSEGYAEAEATVVTRSGKEIPFFFSANLKHIDDEPCILGMGLDVTKQKNTEKALRESEERFREIFDKANDGIEIVEIRDDGFPGNYIDVNEVACRMVRYTRDEMLRMGPLDISTDYSSRPFDDILKEIHTIGHATFETEHRRKDGTIVPVEVNTLILMLLGKSVLVSIIRDISERKVAEEALRESEHRNEVLIDALPDMMFTISREGVYRDFKVSDSDVLAIPADQIVGKTVWETGFTKGSADTIMLNIEEALQTKTLRQFEYELSLPQGLRTFEARMVALSDDEVLGIVRDITDSKQAERELQKLASIVRHSGEFISLATPDGIIIFINEAGARMLGTTPEEVISQPVSDILPEHLKEIVDSELFSPDKKTSVWEGDLQYLNQATGKPIDVHAMIFTITDPSTGELLYLANVSLDITDRKKAEKGLQEANKKLNLLSSITRHDIINQVSAAQMFVELMEMEGEITPDSKGAEDLKTIDEALKTIERQIVFTRDYQDLGVSSPKWCEVGGIVEMVSSSGSEHLNVENEVKNLGIYADPLFEKVIYNLFENAVRHGEKITTIRFRSEETKGGLKLICEDDGVGVPADVKEKIFNREYFTHTGLGLFLSKEILSITGMSITETGEPGVGARFEIFVPDGMWRVA